MRHVWNHRAANIQQGCYDAVVVLWKLRRVDMLSPPLYWRIVKSRIFAMQLHTGITLCAIGVKLTRCSVT